MTKKEQAAFDSLQAEMEMYRAMYISPKVEPDIPRPADHGKRTKGWEPNSYYGSARKASSGTFNHWTGDRAWEDHPPSGSQGTIALWSTEALALRAARHEMSVDFARKLAEMDRKIAAAEAAK